MYDVYCVNRGGGEGVNLLLTLLDVLHVVVLERQSANLVGTPPFSRIGSSNTS